MQSLDVTDTIAAIASAPGGSLRGIIRLSGPKTAECLERIFDSENGQPIAIDKSISSTAGNLILDEKHRLPGRLLFWPTRKSYTRQPTAEFHTFGSPPLLKLCLETICNNGARIAQPGEFTLRAFLSGRIDLTQAEAVLAVIDSNSGQQLKTALTQLAGGLTGPLAEIRSQLIGIVAELEAGLDFVEEDIEFISAQEICKQLSQIRQALSGIVEQIKSRNIEGTGFRVALLGKPNAGKSSLFNKLVGASAAIVSDRQGTTRDFVSAKIELHKNDVLLIDTAGLELDTNCIEQTDTNSIENQAQRHAREQIHQADVRLVCVSSPENLTIEGNLSSDDIVVITKSDLNQNDEFQSLVREHFGPEVSIIRTSSQTGEGIDDLKLSLGSCLQNITSSRIGIVDSTAIRANDSLNSALASVESALTTAEQALGLELVASDLRVSLDELGRVVGKIHTDDILDQVFSRFCIGK